MTYTIYLYLVGKYRDAKEGIANVLQNYGWSQANSVPSRLSELEVSVNSEFGHNGNKHPPMAQARPFYPTNDSSKRGHHNHYEGYNTIIARQLHASRMRIKKPVPLKKRVGHDGMRFQRNVPSMKYGRIFSQHH